MDAKSLIYQFDDVSVDLDKFEIIKADRRAHLEPKAFGALVFLIENRGRLVEKKELLDAVWKDAFVTENAMTRVIAQLRKALGDDSKEAKYIETVPTRGYRFIPEVEINQSPGSNSGEVAGSEQTHGESGLSQATLSGEQSSVAAVAPAKDAATPTPSLDVAPSIGGYLIPEIKRHKTGAILMFSALILVLATSVYFYLTRVSHDAIDSIAVLPFANANGDPDTEYLSDGLTESLINSLSQLRALRVVARSTVFRYKGKEADSPKAGRELGVRAVLSGRVLQRGETLTIQVDLVDVNNGSQLWGEQYDLKMSDLLAIKQKIAREISYKLRLRLSSEEHRQLAKRETGNTQAYQFYLKGRYHFQRRPAEGFKKAIGYFQQALDEDPNYALAYAGLADCYSWLELLEGTPATETYPKAKACAERALQIDETLAEAHTSSEVSMIVCGSSGKRKKSSSVQSASIPTNRRHMTGTAFIS